MTVTSALDPAERERDEGLNAIAGTADAGPAVRMTATKSIQMIPIFLRILTPAVFTSTSFYFLGRLLWVSKLFLLAARDVLKKRWVFAVYP
jgi:hypothetical protein